MFLFELMIWSKRIELVENSFIIFFSSKFVFKIVSIFWFDKSRREVLFKNRIGAWLILKTLSISWSFTNSLDKLSITLIYLSSISFSDFIARTKKFREGNISLYELKNLKSSSFCASKVSDDASIRKFLEWKAKKK